MSTEIDKNGIMHIDGPPSAGFIIPENPDGSGNRIEVKYHTLRYLGSREDVEEANRLLLNLFISEMQDLIKLQPEGKVVIHTRGIIWWRRRPEFSQNPENLEQWQFYCRLATTPPLPDFMWETWETKEGAPGRNAKEVIG